MIAWHKKEEIGDSRVDREAAAKRATCIPYILRARRLSVRAPGSTAGDKSGWSCPICLRFPSSRNTKLMTWPPMSCFISKTSSPLFLFCRRKDRLRVYSVPGEAGLGKTWEHFPLGLCLWMWGGHADFLWVFLLCYVSLHLDKFHRSQLSLKVSQIIKLLTRIEQKEKANSLNSVP